MSEQIRYSKDGAVASLRFNRPEKKNAITVAMYQALLDGLNDAANDDAIRAVGIFGGDVFTAGNDLGDFLAAGAQNHGEELPVIKLIRAMIAFPKPMLAGVKGVAIGFGTTMLMHCDAVVAGRSARFALPFARLGLVPEAGSSVIFPLIAGRTRASWLMLSGEQFGADEAYRIGLATHVADDADVDGAVTTMCSALAELPPKAIASTKRLLKARFAELVDRAVSDETAAFGAALQSDEARAAFMKFLTR
ncbi:MAG TPA: enoyl-CoA hydratase-related protein [Candidatus Acidoferrum sp.]|jgi:enoyl-CoA hydratase/carnithine racemase|nr:enoyl-CoA hydratase-related protein [Candidatus Acidoferrum sp.]